MILKMRHISIPTILSLLFVALVAGEDKGDKTEKALKHITSRGARVSKNEKKPGSPVVEIDFASTRVSDDDLSFLKSLPDIEAINFHNTGVSDLGLVHLKSLKKLRNLYFGNCPGISDVGLK